MCRPCLCLESGICYRWGQRRVCFTQSQSECYAVFFIFWSYEVLPCHGSLDLSWLTNSICLKQHWCNTRDEFHSINMFCFFIFLDLSMASFYFSRVCIKYTSLHTARGTMCKKRHIFASNGLPLQWLSHLW